MSLSVLVKSASSLPNVEKFSKSDPMCVITLEGRITLPESCVYGPYQHFVLIPSRSSSSHTTDLHVFCSMVLREPVNNLLTGAQPTPHLFSLSLSLRFSFCCLQGRRRRRKLSTTILIQNGMRWGLQSPAAKLAMLSYLIPLSFFVLPQSVNPSLSVSHTCTNADFDLELTGSSQWLGGAQGGGLRS